MSRLTRSLRAVIQLQSSSTRHKILSNKFLQKFSTNPCCCQKEDDKSYSNLEGQRNFTKFRYIPTRENSSDSNLVANTAASDKDNHDISNSDQWTHFGYEQVQEEQKQKKVYDVFENVADSYDLMNDLMSAGTHRLWKNQFVRQLKLKPGMKILDMAGGTGDIAFKMLDTLQHEFPSRDRNNSGAEIVVSDINRAMLDVGQKRARKLDIQNAFDWVEANAEELPFEDETFDLYTIAFGIRNTTHIDKVLDEAYRVLKVGGRFSCLEFSNLPNPILQNLYDTYSFEVIPVLGQVFAEDWKSYQYLVESIRQFPNKELFGDMIYDAGFSNVMFEDMTFGVVSIHDGFKI